MDDNQNEFDSECLGEHVGNCQRCGEDVDLGQALYATCERYQQVIQEQKLPFEVKRHPSAKMKIALQEAKAIEGMFRTWTT